MKKAPKLTPLVAIISLSLGGNIVNTTTDPKLDTPVRHFTIDSEDDRGIFIFDTKWIFAWITDSKEESQAATELLMIYGQ